MTRKQFYVVVHGRQPGIYQKWFGEEGAKEQVEGLDDAVFKGFEAFDEALEWLRGFDSETLLLLAPNLLDLVEPPASRRKTKSPDEWLSAGKVVIYAVGVATKDSEPGGYGVVLRFREHRRELSGGFRATTDRRMGLMACVEGIRALRFSCGVMLYSDSRSVVHGMNTGWARRWHATRWRLPGGQPVRNADLWQQLVALDSRHNVRFCLMRGRTSHPEGARCTELATAAARGLNLPADLGYERSVLDCAQKR